MGERWVFAYFGLQSRTCSGSLCVTKEKVEPNLNRPQIGWLRLLRFASVCRTTNEGQKEIIKNQNGMMVLDLKGCRGINVPFAK